MEKIKFFVLVVLLCITNYVSAQNIATNCYRGYIDAGYTFGVGDYDFDRFEVNTSHGFQINPYIYIGGGLGFHFMQEYKTSGMEYALDKRDSKVDIPIFANIRVNVSKGKIVPFLDLKGGTFVTNNGGLYASLSAGLRFALNQKNAIDVSVGYVAEELEFDTFCKFTSPGYNMSYSTSPRKLDTESISLKIGYEF